MFISRRKFIMAGSAVALAAGFPLKNAMTSASQRTSDTTTPNGTAKEAAKSSTDKRQAGLADYTKATFAAHINSTFRIQARTAKPVDVKLIEVKTVGPIPDQAKSGKECFALLFSGQPRLRQDIYTIEHAELGKFGLLLVPVGKDKKGSYYEAVINRLN